MFLILRSLPYAPITSRSPDFPELDASAKTPPSVGEHALDSDAVAMFKLAANRVPAILEPNVAGERHGPKSAAFSARAFYQQIEHLSGWHVLADRTQLRLTV